MGLLVPARPHVVAPCNPPWLLVLRAVLQAFFNGTLLETIDLMRATDVFVGMYGAAFTNLIFLRAGAVAVQVGLGLGQCGGPRGLDKGVLIGQCGRWWA